MTKDEWLGEVRKNQKVLRSLVGNWHPSAREPRAIQKRSVLFTDGSAVAIDVPEAHLPITAPNVELASQRVRQSIRAEEPENPLTRWDKAVVSGDVGEIMSLLDGAWFGVPESTSAWGIEGFREAVDLLDDLPKEE